MEEIGTRIKGVAADRPSTSAEANVSKAGNNESEGGEGSGQPVLQGEAAVGGVHYLEAQAEQIKLLEARAESLARQQLEVRAQMAETERREAEARGQAEALEQQARSLRSALFWHRLLLWLSIAALGAGGIWLRLME